MTDELIINGFCSFDEKITKEYFYGYCLKAYAVYDHKYQLRNKTGLDFYSLAHEYYIRLLIHEFKPLLDRPQEIKLSTWMTNGFRFVVLDALKSYSKEFSQIADSTADDVLEFVRSNDYEEDLMLQVADAVASHYKSDRTMLDIAHYIFYDGYSQKDVAEMIHMTPSAVNQRYKKMMDEVVVPFVIENYSDGLYRGAMFESAADKVPYTLARKSRYSAIKYCLMEMEPPKPFLQLPKKTLKEKLLIFHIKLKRKLKRLFSR